MIEGDIPVTRPFLPPYEEFEPYLRDIWSSRQLTNNGKFHRLLEEALQEYLGVRHMTLTSNGTVSLSIALRALDIKGEVITTPFSFPATTHAIWWNGNMPVFADIDTEYLNIDPDKIEQAITEKTSAILAAHIYGNPCHVDRIKQIADKHGLFVIYDACHAFGIKYRDESLLNAGDLSVLSFHPTKVFTTLEGGAVVSHNPEQKKQLDLLKNFGIANEETVLFPGINGKMNEVQAAFGMLQLKYVDETILKRKIINDRYRENLSHADGIKIIPVNPETEHNYSYFPVLVDRQIYCMTRDELYDKLKRHRILSRKYFSPLISHIPGYDNLPSASASNLPAAEKIAGEILCLPVYPDLELSMVDRICELIINKSSGPVSNLEKL